MAGEESAPTPQPDTAWAGLVVKLIAAIPFALATLAVLYDAGYFARIGFDFFSLFSLTEHLMFGMEGIPYLIIILVLVYFVVVLTLRDPTHQAQNARNLYWAGLASLVFGVPGSLFLYPGVWPNAALIFVTGLMFMLQATERSSYAVVTIAGNFVIWLLTSFTLGYWMAAGILNPRDAPIWEWCSTAPTTGVLLNNGPPLSGRVLRSGERGLLVFNKLDGSIQFKRWDEVRGIETTP